MSRQTRRDIYIITPGNGQIAKLSLKPIQKRLPQKAKPKCNTRRQWNKQKRRRKHSIKKAPNKAGSIFWQ